MKIFFSAKTLMAAVLVAAAGNIGQAQDQPLPPPAEAEALPPNIEPNSPLAQIIKLAQAGVAPEIMRNFIVNTTGPFGLDAEKIIYLNDLGVPVDLINAMLNHDKQVPPPIAATPPPPTSNLEPAPASAVTVNYFYDTLTPYGSWVEVEGYGRCWRPTAVIYDSSWQPYSDRGHWVYSDYGWYWESDYSWGSTFHYGRWFRNPHYGWCWWPDTVWAPSWVTWRSGGDYCGWAPLPPFTTYRPGLGFFYRNASVSVGFSFGLEASCFTFVTTDRLCDRRPRYFRAEGSRVTQIFNQTTVINNYNEHNRTIINGGISIDRINTGSHRPIQPVAISQIPNASRHGWRGNDDDWSNRRSSGGSGGQNPPGLNRPNPTSLRNGQNHDAQPGRPPEHGQPSATPNRNGSEISPSRPTGSTQPGNRTGPREDANRNLTPPVNNPAPSATGNHNPQRVTPQPGASERSQPANNGQPNRPAQPQAPAPVTPPLVTPPVNRDQPSRISQPQLPPRVVAPVVTPPMNRAQPGSSQPSGASFNRNPQRTESQPTANNHSPAANNNWQPNRPAQPQSAPAFNTPRNSEASAPVTHPQPNHTPPPQSPPTVTPPRISAPPTPSTPAAAPSPARNSDRSSGSSQNSNRDKDKQNR